MRPLPFIAACAVALAASGAIWTHSLEPAPHLTVVDAPTEPAAHQDKPPPFGIVDMTGPTAADRKRAAREFADMVRSLPRTGRLAVLSGAGGHAVFAADHCPGMSVHEESIAEMWRAFGVPTGAQSLEERQYLAERLLTVYGELAKDAEAGCDRAWLFFGDEGTKYPGLLERR